jgi:hypothetical protein
MSKQKHSKGKLIGWIVSYQLNKKGAAFELREGRTLLGKDNEIKDAISFKDRNMSSPHLAILAEPETPLRVQDIFSQDGSFLTKGNSDNEIVIKGTTELEHGDWIRVGQSTRFQICLLSGAYAAN